MKYDIVNVAEGELGFGAAYFDTLTKSMYPRFISAAIKGKNGKLSHVEPYVIKNYGKVRVGVVGIFPGAFGGQQLAEDNDIQILNPINALEGVLPELKKKSDIIILLAHMGYSGSENLMQYNEDAISGVDVIIVGHGRNLTREAKQINGKIVVQNSMAGEYLGKLVLRFSKDNTIESYQLETIALTDDIPDDPGASAIMEKFKKDKHLWNEADLKKREATKYLHMKPQEFLDMAKKNEKQMDMKIPEQLNEKAGEK